MRRFLITTAGALALFSASSASAQNAPTPPPEFGQAVQQFNQQNFAAAVDLLEGVTEAVPEFPQGWLFLARALAGAGESDRAHQTFERARGFAPIAPQVDFFEGLVYAGEGDLDRAFELLLEAKDSGRYNVTNVGLSPAAAALQADPRYRSLFPSETEYAEPFIEDVEIIHDWAGEAAGDQFGWIARNIGDVDGDGVDDAVTNALSWSGGQGRVYVYSGRSGELIWTVDGKAGELLGQSVDEAGDVDGDGVGDVVGGSPATGRVYVWSGVDGSVLHTFTDEVGNGFGGGVSGAGDLNGDGHGDVLVGAGAAGNGTGFVRVYSGADGSVLWEREGEAEGHTFGSMVGGWVHGDDILLLVGAPGAGDNQAGITYVFDGTGPEPRFRIEADDTGAQNGMMFVSVLGDVDGDDVPDVYSSDFADGANAPGAGRIYVHSGRTGERLFAIGGEFAGEGFGIGVADAGDVTGDGLADLVVGAWQHGSAAVSGGKVYIYDGRSAELLYSITGDVPGETFGFDATGLGDVNGDGHTDFLLTSAWSGINGTRSGRVLVVAGRPTG